MTDAEILADAEERRKKQFPTLLENLWQEDSLHHKSFLKCTFSDDDCSNKKITDLCKKYCTNSDKMLENNIGVLFFGDVGTGKTFYAGCLCNAIIEARKHTLCATNFVRILNFLQSAQNRQSILDRLDRYKFLMLDDVGAERTSEFSQEQLFNVIDGRYRAELPVIVTTNLSLKELENPENLSDARLFDRVLEMCPIRVHVPGSSKRKAEAERRTQLARELLK